MFVGPTRVHTSLVEIFIGVGYSFWLYPIAHCAATTNLAGHLYNKSL
jgi:hypothetical protein